MSRRLRQVALCDKAAAAPESRAASSAAIALWQAAGKMQDAGMGNAIDAGLLMVVRDKIDAMLMEPAEMARAEAADTARDRAWDDRAVREWESSDV